MPRVAVDVYALIENLFAEFCFSICRRKRTASFFSTACIEIESHKAGQIGNCLWLENRRINAWLQYAWITRVESLANRFVGDASSVEFCDVEMVSQKVSRTGPIVRSCSCL